VLPGRSGATAVSPTAKDNGLGLTLHHNATTAANAKAGKTKRILKPVVEPRLERDPG
jgi:hypothetical protein